MILRPLEPVAPTSSEFLPAWNVIERTQRQAYKNCWMITQPSHAALAGEFAASLTGAQVPKLDDAVLRAIALHDAGWGVPDAQAIMQSRAVGQGNPKSFIDCGASEFVAAWEKSIEIAESAGAAGGYVVSRHFARIAEHGLAKYPAADRQKVSRFLEHETARQKKLAATQDHSAADLEQLTEVLRFCDLLSLYVCSDARENAEFPEYFGVKARLTVEAESYQLEPALIDAGAEFAVAALRHPAVRGESGKEIEIRFA
ncbi:MAG TPA: DUF3891 family protein [Candidatus Angelobacter sp.]|jgi:hypothetical protein|nr:DUF3891 family protein [Candidatus Angelobacter sp.]